jgi:hypothetical protein
MFVRCTTAGNTFSHHCFSHPKEVSKSTSQGGIAYNFWLWSDVRFLLWWNSLNKIFNFRFWVEICMECTLRTPNFWANWNSNSKIEQKRDFALYYQYKTLKRGLNSRCCSRNFILEIFWQNFWTR